MKVLRDYLRVTDTPQQAFAERLGVKQPTVWGWLNGKHFPSAGMLKRISLETGISIDKLMADIEAA
jgi:transcriptional regulator with XRE-family HTH domain